MTAKLKRRSAGGSQKATRQQLLRQGRSRLSDSSTKQLANDICGQCEEEGERVEKERRVKRVGLTPKVGIIS